MKKINWIIIKNISRGFEYGVGTFVKNMIQGLSILPEYDIFVIEIGSNCLEDFYIESNEAVTFLHFSKAWYFIGEDTVSNQIKHAKNILRILQPYIPKERETVIHLNFITQYYLGQEFKRAYNATILFTQHMFIETFNNNQYYFNLEKNVYNMVDHVVTVTNHGKNFLTERFNSSDKITTIYNGVNPMPFNNSIIPDDVRGKYGLLNTDHYIIYSGRLDLIKGLRYLAEAFKLVVKEVPNCRLVIAGDGNFTEVIDFFKEVSSNVNYLGFIPFNDLIVLYKHALIGVMQSLEEHCSYVALEMLHSGLPVVASRIGGLKEIFVHGENAFLTDTIPDASNVFGLAPDVGQMAEYIITLLKNKTLREMFSRNAVQRANSIFTTEHMVKNYIGITLNPSGQ